MHDWNKGFVATSANVHYERIAHDIDKAMRFMVACGVDVDAISATEFYSAHEALLLDYERPLTRVDSRTGKAYDTSAHFVWVGERTRDPTARTSTSPRGSATRRHQGLGKADPAELLKSSRRSTRSTSPAGSASSPGWGRAPCATPCPPSSRR